MFQMITKRFFHTSYISLSTSRTSALAKLRKSTGYSVSNCKKALEEFPEDVSKAEEWLHAQAKQKGWAKWAKIQERSAAQGLIGVYSKDKVGVMVEVNCETDFVARNVEFQQLVGNILTGCLNHIQANNHDGDIFKTVLDEAQLNSLQLEHSNVSELITKAVNKFNEKTVAKRALFIKVSEDLKLSALSHPGVECPSLPGATLGKYGTLLTLRQNEQAMNEESVDIGLNVCQHIIGMNPSTVGELTEKDVKKFTEKGNEDVLEDPEPVPEEITVFSDETDDKIEGQETVDIKLKDSEEERLLFQPYLLDTNVTVGETLHKAGVEIVDFQRFECGEGNIEIEEKQCASVGI